MDQTSKQQGSNGDHLLKVLGLLAFAALIQQAFVKFQAWWAIWIVNPWHQLGLASAIGIIGAGLFVFLYFQFLKRKTKSENDKAVLGKTPDAVYCGEGSPISETKKSKKVSIWVKPSQRAMHTQVVGTTNAGKTESVILPWAIQDIQQGRGLLLIDGKSDRSLLEKLWAYTHKAGREKDFHLVSLSNLNESHAFNPLTGGSSAEVTERVMNAFNFENPHFKSVQFELFGQVMRVFEECGEIPTFLKIYQAITKPEALFAMAQSDELKAWAEFYRDLSSNERSQRTSGLTAALSHFAFGKASPIFNTENPTFTIDSALQENKIIYFQLPVLLSPFLGAATGKMVLQCLQAAIANRHRGSTNNKQFFSVFLDDFSEYLYDGFVSALNKSRSANVGVVFAHQALGDISALGDSIANSILTNANVKVFMRGNDPDSAEYYSRLIGTNKAEKTTERKRKTFFKSEATGDVSAREVDEFIIHPNRFKRELGVGEAVMVIPHNQGSQVVNIKFKKHDDLIGPALAHVEKEKPKSLARVATGV